MTTFRATFLKATTKREQYDELAGQLHGLLDGESDMIANAANMSALVYHGMQRLNWAGFYFLKTPAELVLGPFQGKPACVRIAIGRGVCGTAVERRSSIVVEDVHAFPGHIACDAASRSELVVPLLFGEAVVGVFDLDSPDHSRFDDEEQASIERLVGIFMSCTAFD